MLRVSLLHHFQYQCTTAQIIVGVGQNIKSAFNAKIAVLVLCLYEYDRRFELAAAAHKILVVMVSSMQVHNTWTVVVSLLETIRLQSLCSPFYIINSKKTWHDDWTVFL